MKNQKFLNCVLKQQPTEPIWFFRQAGRYLPEYRALRQKEPNFLRFCYTPDYCIEAVLQPIRRFDLDAAIVFSDILVIPDALGQKVWFEGGVGPKLQPLQAGSLSANFAKANVTAHLQPVYDAIEGMIAALDDKPLIGFSGSPWTLACYMIEGQGSRDFFTARRTALIDQSFPSLICLLEEVIVEHLSAQIDVGVKAVQLFDSWSGILSPRLFDQWVIEPTRRIVSNLKKLHPEIPVMGFARGSGIKNRLFAEKTGIDVVTVDETMPRQDFQSQNIVYQGNLDSALLLGDQETLRDEIAFWKKETKGKPWVYNLGHGVHKDTNPDNVQFLIDCLRNR